MGLHRPSTSVPPTCSRFSLHPPTHRLFKLHAKSGARGSSLPYSGLNMGLLRGPPKLKRGSLTGRPLRSCLHGIPLSLRHHSKRQGPTLSKLQHTPAETYRSPPSSSQARPPVSLIHLLTRACRHAFSSTMF